MNKNIKEYTKEKSYQYCHYCGWKNIKDETLPIAGMPISGLYDICPKCKKHWEYDEIITEKIIMVTMTKKYFNLIKKGDLK